MKFSLRGGPLRVEEQVMCSVKPWLHTVCDHRSFHPHNKSIARSSTALAILLGCQNGVCFARNETLTKRRSSWWITCVTWRFPAYEKKQYSFKFYWPFFFSSFCVCVNILPGFCVVTKPYFSHNTQSARWKRIKKTFGILPKENDPSYPVSETNCHSLF